MKKLFIALCWTLICGAVHAADLSEHDKAIQEIKSSFGIVPTFFKEYPEGGLAGAWEEFKVIQLNPKTALDPKTKELIGLAVAAQIPCRYCAYFHKRAAKFDGATNEEINTAIAVSANQRKWATYFSGAQLDMTAFKADVDKMAANAKKSEQKPAAVAVTDLKSAKQDIQNTFGFVPSFLNQYPEASLPGAWKEVKNILLSSEGLPEKNKILISLAVGSQTPCNYCVYIDTEMAKAQGASPQELQEAVAMAGIVRHWSTVLNGIQQDEKAFQKEVNVIFQHLEKSRTEEKMRMRSARN